MISYYEFKESKKEEDKEEKNGLDYDNDHEKGESKEHKNKVKKRHKETIDFFEKRREGARNIANQASSKNTDASKLTYWHFRAKDIIYQTAIQGIKNNEKEIWFRNKYKQAVKNLHVDNFKQQDFQTSTGVLEVWGEVISELFN